MNSPLKHSPRILSGRWKGRKILLSKGQLFRPTLARVRQTLFDWLRPHLCKMSVVDLYAGSGALGLEALSQGAKCATLIERDPDLSRALSQFVKALPNANATVICTDALAYLNSGLRHDCHLVLVDPPFHAQLLPRTIASLAQATWLNPSSFIYCECRRDQAVFEVPGHWKLYRSGSTLNTFFALFTVEARK